MKETEPVAVHSLRPARSRLSPASESPETAPPLTPSESFFWETDDLWGSLLSTVIIRHPDLIQDPVVQIPLLPLGFFPGQNTDLYGRVFPLNDLCQVDAAHCLQFVFDDQTVAETVVLLKTGNDHSFVRYIIDVAVDRVQPLFPWL